MALAMAISDGIIIIIIIIMITIMMIIIMLMPHGLRATRDPHANTRVKVPFAMSSAKHVARVAPVLT